MSGDMHIKHWNGANANYKIICIYWSLYSKRIEKINGSGQCRKKGRKYQKHLNHKRFRCFFMRRPIQRKYAAKAAHESRGE